MSLPAGLDLGAPIGSHGQVHPVEPATTTTTTTTEAHPTSPHERVVQPHSDVVIQQPPPPQPQVQVQVQTQPQGYQIPPDSQPQPRAQTQTLAPAHTRPLPTRRQTPRPTVQRTQSSYTDHPPSPPPKSQRVLPGQAHRDASGVDGDRNKGFIGSGTAIQPDYEPRDDTADDGYISKHGHRGEPNADKSALAQPATSLSPHPSSQPPTEAQGNTLPTSRSTHPSVQAAHLQRIQEHGTREEKDMVGRELEKAEADRRAIRGEEAKGGVVEGLEDDQLFALMRRFDQDVTHTLILTSVTPLPYDQPDLRRSVLPDVPYSTDIIKSNLERLYASGGTGVMRGIGEMMRLRSWAPEERRRTMYFCSTYFLGWVLGLAIPTVVGFMMVLIVSPESRMIFFPPVPPKKGMPPSATDPTNRKGDETLLGGTDSAVTHKSVAEQKEEAAWEFRSLAETFMVKLAVSHGKTGAEGNSKLGQKEVGPDSDATSVTTIDSDDDFLDARDNDNDDPDSARGITSDMYAEGEHPTEIIRQNKASRGIYDDDAEDAGMGGKTKRVKSRSSGKKVDKPLSEKERKKLEGKEAKVKRDALVGKYLKLTQDGLGDAADMTEIMVNALKPPPPFPPSINMARYKIAGAIFLPILLATAFVPSWVWARGASFLLGFLFFGQPILDRGLALLMEKVPNWADYLDMRNSLLFGVPTNDQLVIHLLRVGEKEGHPLPRPPPPPLAGTPKEQIKDNAPDPDAELVDDEGNPMSVEDLPMKDKVVHKSKNRLIGGLKKMSKRVAGIGADVTVDGVKKQVGGKVDRLIWGDMLKDDGDIESYPCRLNGKNGHIVLDPRSEWGVPTISYRTAAIGSKEEFTRDINDIVELKKLGISVPRAVLGWASGADVESQTLLLRMKTSGERAYDNVNDMKEAKGLNSVDGDTYEFQTVGRREQLFARLISMGNQRWESL